MTEREYDQYENAAEGEIERLNDVIADKDDIIAGLLADLSILQHQLEQTLTYDAVEGSGE